MQKALQAQLKAKSRSRDKAGANISGFTAVSKISKVSKNSKKSNTRTINAAGELG